MARAVTGSYEVLLDNFEGPLDLLLKLVQREKLDIREVEVSRITQNYIRHIRAKQIDPDHVDGFISVASQLLLTKSKRILPGTHEGQQESGEVDDAELIARRVEAYQQCRGRAAELAQRAKMPLLERQARQLGLPAQARGGVTVDPTALRALWTKLSKLHADRSIGHRVRIKKLRIEDVLAQVLDKLTQQHGLRLDALILGSRNRHEAVLSFLAVLELAKQRGVEMHILDDSSVLLRPMEARL